MLKCVQEHPTSQVGKYQKKYVRMMCCFTGTDENVEREYIESDSSLMHPIYQVLRNTSADEIPYSLGLKIGWASTAKTQLTVVASYANVFCVPVTQMIGRSRHSHD